MRIELLGPPRLRVDDGPWQTLRSRRQRAVLTVLILADGGPVSPDRLIDAVWGDDLPSNPTNTLQQTIAQLRKRLMSDRASEGDPPVLELTGGGYRLARSAFDTDLADFERGGQRARELHAGGDLTGALAAATSALQLWRSAEAFGGVAGVDIVEAARRRLDEERMDIRQLTLDCRQALDGPEAVVPELEALSVANPHRDDVWHRLITALYGSGRQADALRAFQRAVEAAADVGLDVSPALRHLEQQVLTQDGALDLRPHRPVATTPARVATNLPSPDRPLIGRAAELTEVGSALAGSRLVTLTGSGGAGKTVLAIEAARIAATSADGRFGSVWLARLDQLDDPELIGPTIALAVGMAESGDADLRDNLAEHLRGQGPVLLLLDNCEHLALPVAALGRHLLDRCGELTILATSQVPLGLRGEYRIAVGPLAVPVERGAPGDDIGPSPAVELFLDRARTAGGAPPDPDGVAAVARIVRLLEGMPLAIELAAARTRSLTPNDIAEQLLGGFELLNRGPADAPERQRTLAATLDWSYRLLGSSEQVAFERLAVFAGSFDLDAAAAVLELDRADAVDAIDALVSCSILDRSEPIAGGSRFRLLSTLRSFGERRLAARGDEGFGVRSLHARWFADRALDLERKLISGDQAVAYASILADEDNLRAAMAWCLRQGPADPALLRAGAVIAGRLGRFWDWRGDLSEAATWLGRYGETVGTIGDDAEICLLYSWLAFFSSELGDDQTNERAGVLAGAAAERSRDPYSLMIVAAGRGVRLRLTDRPADALAEAERVSTLAQELRLGWWIALADNLRTLALLDLGDLGAASEAADRAERGFEAAADRRATGWVLTSKAQIALATGDASAAAGLAERAAVISASVGDGRNAAWALQIQAEATVVLGTADDDDRVVSLRAQAEEMLTARGMSVSLWPRG